MLNADRVFYKIILAIAGLCLGIIISELIASVYIKYSKLDKKISYLDEKRVSFSSRNRISYHQLDTELGFSLKAHAQDTVVSSDFTAVYSINSCGLRDKEFPLDKPKGEFRILALGESTVFGEGVNYGLRLTEVIEQALKNVEVVNMGIEGFGLDQSFLYLRRDGFRFNPDAVMVFIFSKDYLDRCMDITIRGSTIAKPRFILNDDKSGLVLEDTSHTRKEFKSEFSPQESRVLSLPEVNEATLNKKDNNIRIGSSSIVTLVNYYAKKKKIDELIRAGDTEFFHNLMGIIAWQEKRRQRYKPEDVEKLLSLLIGEYQQICKEHGVDFLIINMGYARLGFVEHVCKKLNISYLDLSEIVRSASQSEQLHFLIDPHFNGIYHRVVGEYASDYIQKKYNIEGNSGYLHRYLGRFHTVRQQ